LIEVKNLTKRYGNHLAVDNLSFTVETGQIYGFLGPNGAGKSTTMNIITGYLAPSEGTVTINEHDILEDPEEARKCIGYLPEFPPLYMDMTVQEYLKFSADLKKLPKSEKKQMIDEAIETTALTKVQDRLIRNLSKGYKQRVGLAQAILGLPEVIILDEPTVGLDPLQIIEIRDMIKELGKNHTVILSSHILSEVSAICDHILIISNGKLVASDTPENLMNLMQGNPVLELRVRGSEDAVAETLRSLSGVESFDISGDDEFCDVSIQCNDDTDATEQIFFAFANAALPIYKMIPSKRSLEDIFIELTDSSDKSVSSDEETNKDSEEVSVEFVEDDADIDLSESKETVESSDDSSDDKEDE
jgi:ABC-2 type transport system ATP-binding protein